MAKGSAAGEYLADLPGALVIRAQQDLDFALRLLDRESRQDAFGELGLDLTDEEANSLHERLDAIARLSFQDAMQMLRTAGVGILM